jgi:hypothetical protein
MRISLRAVGTLLPIAALALAGLVAPATADSGDGKSNQKNVIYSSLTTPLPGNLPSEAFEANQVSEFGNAVTFAAGSGRDVNKVVVTMSSWGCATGGWSTNNCVTPQDAKFTEPITLNIYKPSADGGKTPGAKITTVTKTFAIPYRPSASPNCAVTTKWYQSSSGNCYNGLATNITFNLENVTVPNSAIFGIAYNTTHYGYAPIGESAACFTSSAGCGYDSLNVGLSEDSTAASNNVTVGSNVTPGKLWLTSSTAEQYADKGAAGTGTFRLDSPTGPVWWGVNDPRTSAPFYTLAFQVFAGHGKNDGKSEGNNQSDSGHHNTGNSQPSQGNSVNHLDPGHGVKKD